MSRNNAEEILQTPQLSRQVRLRQYPAAAQSAETVGFGQAACGYKLGTELKAAWTRTAEYRFEINLIGENLRAGLACQFTEPLHGLQIGQRSGWIVHVRHHDQLRAARQRAFKSAEIQREAVVAIALEALDGCAEIVRNREQWIVGGMFDDHFVARIENGRHRQVIGHRCPLSMHHAI